METKQPSITVPALIAGVGTAIICIIYSAILYATVGMQHSSLRYILYLFLAAVIFVATKQFRDKKSEGFISYGRALGFGTLISFFAGIVFSVYTFIYMSMSPQLIDQIIEQAKIKMANTPDMTPEKMDMGLKVVKIFSSPSMIAIFSVLGFVFVGFIISLIIAAILQKDKPVFDSSETQA